MLLEQPVRKSSNTVNPNLSERLRLFSPSLLALVFAICSFIYVVIQEQEKAWSLKGEREFDGVSFFVALVAAFIGGIMGIAVAVFVDVLFFGRKSNK